MITPLTKKLPEPIKKPLRWLYDKWRLRIIEDGLLMKDLSEYFEMSEKDVRRFLKKGLELNTDLWRAMHPASEEEIKQFYAITPYYIFELSHWHMLKHLRDFRHKVVNRAYGDTLDYGGGMGIFCLDLAAKGLKVSYADVAGRTFEFARWLFEKRNLPIEMVDLSRGGLAKDYDTIICIDVIEHVPQPKVLLKELASCVRAGGVLVINNIQVDKILGTHPMHYKVDFAAEEHLKSLGFRKGEFPWLWRKS